MHRVDTIIKASIQPPNLNKISKEDILEWFQNTWDLNETLFTALKDKATFQMVPNPLRRPLVFYYGHTAVVYMNKMMLAGVVKKRINPHLESLLAVGVDEMSWDDMDANANIDWPSYDEVRAFRQKVHDVIVEKINTANINDGHIGWDDPEWSILMGIDHARIHFETSSVLIRELPIEFVKPIPGWTVAESSGKPPANEMIQVSTGEEITLGKNRDHPSYGWDTEYGSQTITTYPFKASKFLVSNWEFLKFVKDNGYDRQELWTPEGWKWRTETKNGQPHFWVKDESAEEGFKYRAMTDIISMPWDWPVDCNYYEAKAFTIWKGKGYRLLTEAEWHQIRDKYTQEPPYDDLIYQDKLPHNINLQHFSSTPINKYPPNKMGFYDVHGNVWQWAEDFNAPFKGFKPHDYYDDFSVPCFDNEHNMILGGSWISTGNEASVYTRFAFRRHFYQHSGFRYVYSENKLPANLSCALPNPCYESDEAVAQYLFLHYAKNEELFPYSIGPASGVGYPVQIAKEAMEYGKGISAKRVLDVGCSVGRTSFEMTKYFEEVVGLDFSARFIQCGHKLIANGSLSYSIKEEGSNYKDLVANVPDGVNTDRVSFWQGDAQNMSIAKLGTYDVVLMSNILDRLNCPRASLSKIPAFVEKGGLLLLTSPYNWSEDFTPRSEWIGGNEKESSLEALQKELGEYFELVDTKNMQLVERDHIRKFDWTVLELSVWKRNNKLWTL